MLKLSKTLEKLYNGLGNSYITHNFIEGPYEFTVNVRHGIPYKDGIGDVYDYVIEVYSIPDIPTKGLTYKPELNKWADGVDISVIQNHFKNLVSYVYPNIGTIGNIVGVKFMNIAK